MTLAGNEVHLDTDAVGVLEEHRVVPGREVRVFRRMYDVCVELVDEEAMDGVDVLAAARAEAEVMEPGPVLIVRNALAVARRAADENAGAAADAVDDAVAFDQRRHLEKVAEPLPEGDAALRIVDGELNVGDAVDRDAHGPSCVPAFCCAGMAMSPP